MSHSKSKLRISIKKTLNAGFGIAEAMISLGILGVVIVGLVSQQRLSVKGSVNASSDTEINNIVKRVTTEIGMQSICSLPKGGAAPLTGNFKDRTFADPEMADLPKLVRGMGGTAAEIIIAKDGEYGSGQGIVVVERISARLNPDNNHEMLLTIKFKKKVDKTDANILKRFTAVGIEKEIPITVVMKASTPTEIEACYASYDLIVKSAVELACQGPGANYRADLNPPYGECHHQTTDIECPAGQYLKTIAATETTPITYTCASFNRTCPVPGEFITEFRADGSVTCGKAFLECLPGQVLVKNGAGVLVCTTIDCTTPATPVKAFSGFDANGIPKCNEIPTDQNCGSTNFATQVNNDGSVVCNKAVVQTGGCNLGEFVSGINSAGAVICTPWIRLNNGCNAGYAVSGVDGAGNIQCKPIRRPLACGGGSGHSYAECRALGGTIRDIYTNNSHCELLGNSCAAYGWSRCGSWGKQVTQSCNHNTNTFYCAGTNYAPAFQPLGYGPYAADNAYLNSAQGAVWCINNYGYPLTGHACYAGNSYVLTSAQTTVGCY